DELKEAEGVLKMLEVLFSTRIEQKEKSNILNDEFNIPMTEELEKEVSDMCNLSQGIRDWGRVEGMALGIEKGRAEGINLGRAEGRTEGIEMNCISNIKQLMKNLNFTAEQAMTAIGLSEKDRIYYMSVINKES
ncbi:MAG: hypothetical protein J1F64_04485, partial [Oscillospiraceae bacterium]|nr:hypothetical protein [Oscillospiraceae bacterium]